MRWLGAFIVCILALMLPWRLRVMFANAMGWTAQGVYFLYYSLIKYLLKNLQGKKSTE